MYDGHRLIDTLRQHRPCTVCVINWVIIVKTTRDQTKVISIVANYEEDNEEILSKKGSRFSKRPQKKTNDVRFVTKGY